MEVALAVVAAPVDAVVRGTAEAVDGLGATAAVVGGVEGLGLLDVCIGCDMAAGCL